MNRELEFVPYNIAIALKELRFDEPCFAFYRNDRQNKKLEFTNIELSKNYNGINSKDLFISKKEDLFLFTSCPTFSQAFRFFRKKYKLDSYYIEPTKNTHGDKCYAVLALRTATFNGKFDTYEEAETACLNKLIKIANETTIRN